MDWDKEVADAVYGEHRTVAAEAMFLYEQELAEKVSL